MNRLVIMTVGKTHSGKTTFAKALEKEMQNSVVIDQDNHAEFLNTYYPVLLPIQEQPNLIKCALTKTIVQYAIDETNCHLILCNSNRNRKSRLKLLKQYHNKGFTSILVNFDVPEHILKERIAKSNRSKAVLRTASTFEEVLIRQGEEANKEDVTAPLKDEANHLFIIQHPDAVRSIIRKIRKLAYNLEILN
ncbi:AAA family ATPase [Chengkuizengella axinellae]|uniref:AAA family ATPase n=1 Tax=Chengkuizengella axinellae TaxID=3064388 RepID=A0ABT9J5F9_9BACL|nr:AAA family ATPase [Chengkuizengella sp. 2205SS18-9]MDP5276718.1 AAA family ATPase [Chengkuizengella sp. 2205SS18-9]